MADVMVQKTQEYLNAMYGHDSRFKKIDPVDGRTGWTTIYALTRALQIELEITSTADNFGPSTKSKFSAKYPNGIKQQSSNDKTENNIYAIIQGALWCNGYGTGASGITKHFYSGTGDAIKKLKGDAGASSTDSTVTLNVMSALLSMNQYKLVLGGTSQIRQIQQSINKKYESYVGLAPCDGLYGRDMNKALIKVLQAIELFRYALCYNGYTNSTLSTGWNDQLVSIIKEFQSDLALPITGKGDLNTWMSLLLSKGNPDRPAHVCDTRFEITKERGEQLKSLGYNTVGRYLSCRY